jgi:Tol biopolymer transport system component
MSVHHHRTALVTALVGCVVLVLASPAHATYPGNNGLIAFHSQTAEGTQIFTVRPNGRDLRQITRVDGDASTPDWSPDGRKIAFDIATDVSVQIAIMNADGSGIHTLPILPGNIVEADASFTPDGRRILFNTSNGSVEGLWSMKLDGTDRRQIKAGPSQDPNASPDGRRLAFMAFNGEPGGQALFTSGIAGNNPTRLTPFSFNVGAKLDWAPDGKQLAFIHNADFARPGESANIATIRPNGTGLRFVTRYRGANVNAFVGTYSPDGRWIVFRLEDHGRFGLYKVRPDGTQLRPILGLSDFAPRFIDWGARPR